MMLKRMLFTTLLLGCCSLAASAQTTNIVTSSYCWGTFLTACSGTVSGFTGELYLGIQGTCTIENVSPIGVVDPQWTCEYDWVTNGSGTVENYYDYTDVGLYYIGEVEAEIEAAPAGSPYTLWSEYNGEDCYGAVFGYYPGDMSPC